MTLRIVAELSANHNGSMARAVAIMSAAANAGADAIKLQTFTPEQMADPGKIVDAGAWAGANLLNLYRRAHTPREWHGVLFAAAEQRGITCFSSVFHPDDVDFLETLNCPMYKIASFELTDLALIRHAASTGKPLIMSTGMATAEEIFEAVTAAESAGMAARKNWLQDSGITLLKCTSAYPTPPSEANLATMVDLKRYGNVAVGLSDHSKGIGVAVAAAALGASMIEKHLTLDRTDGGLDAHFSMEPDEFAQMVKECRRAAAAVGAVRYGPTPAEAEHLALRRSSGGKRGT